MEHILIENIESLKQATKFMRITNDITPIGFNAINLGLDALIEVVKNTYSNNQVDDSLPLTECPKCGELCKGRSCKKCQQYW